MPRDTDIGSARLSFITLSSTNQFARELLAKTRPTSGTVITATAQTAGRGQFGRSWYGTKGKNLFLTIILYPDLPASEAFRLGMIAALSVHGALNAILSPFGHSVSVKWPNDILCGEGKLAGILIENAIAQTRVRHSLVGIGINVNETDFPPEIPNALSLSMLTGRRFDTGEVLQEVLTAFDAQSKKYLYGPEETLRTAYEKALYGKGRRFSFVDRGNNSRFEALISGVSPGGCLILDTGSEIREYAHGEIELRTDAKHDN